MAESTGKHAAHIPGNGGYLAEGPDLQEKQPTSYLYDAPTYTPHPGKHQSGVGGPNDRNNNGADDKKEYVAPVQRWPRKIPGALFFDWRKKWT